MCTELNPNIISQERWACSRGSIRSSVSSVQFGRSVVSDSLRPHEPQHARPLPVHHQLLESTQTHVHWVGDAIQPSHPLSSPSPPAFHLSQHQGLFKWVSSPHQVAKGLEFQLQHQSFQWPSDVSKKISTYWHLSGNKLSFTRNSLYF